MGILAPTARNFWLWDVDYEQLAGRRVIATGPRAADLAIRLSYAEVEHEVIPDMATATMSLRRIYLSPISYDPRHCTG